MCYKSSENVATGYQAKLECEAMEAVLASVRDEETARFIRDLLGGWVPLPCGPSIITNNTSTKGDE